MNLRIVVIAAAPALLVLGCATMTGQEPRNPRAQAALATALQGRTPGQPVDCITNFRTTQMQIIDDWTILFREGSTIYVQKPQGGCRGITSGANTLVTRPFGVNQLCRGDINQLVNLSSGVQAGACVFSDFVPYRRPG